MGYDSAKESWHSEPRVGGSSPSECTCFASKRTSTVLPRTPGHRKEWLRFASRLPESCLDPASAFAGPQPETAPTLLSGTGKLVASQFKGQGGPSITATVLARAI